MRRFPQTFPEYAVTLPSGDALSAVPADVQFGFFFFFSLSLSLSSFSPPPVGWAQFVV